MKLLSWTVPVALFSCLSALKLQDGEGRHKLRRSQSNTSRSQGDFVSMLDEWRAEDASEDVTTNRKNVLWLHLHNFGGTFVCQEAARQGERTPPANCDWEGCSQQTGLIGCAHKAKSKTYSFSMLERNLQPSDLCTDALHGTMLRDPIAGIKSTIAANGFELAKIMEMILTQNGNVTTDHGPSCLPEWDHYQHFDNFATRSLSGAYTVPPKGVTTEHLAIAKQRLQNMDVVLILEELKDHWSQLSDHFGWKKSLTDPSKHVHSGPVKHGDGVVMQQSEEAFLRDLNVHDYELFATAKGIARERTSASKAKRQIALAEESSFA